MINEWLSGKDKLNLGYKLVYKSNNNNSRYVLPSRKISSIDQAVAMFEALGDELKITLSAEDLNENPTAEEWDISRAFEGLSDLERFRSSLDLGEISSKDTAVALWDCKNHIEVTAGDIGVGVSQLLPLVVAGVVVENGLVACEQPELHVHPRVQVAIGDLLLQAAGEKNFLIETHSEHIILRLLRRVRETSENSLPSNMEPVHPEDISIVYLEPSDDGVSVRRIQIDEDGEFKSRWPQGFFPERREELL
jgi:hypothetical protein